MSKRNVRGYITAVVITALLISLLAGGYFTGILNRNLRM